MFIQKTRIITKLRSRFFACLSVLSLLYYWSSSLFYGSSVTTKLTATSIDLVSQKSQNWNLWLNLFETCYVSTNQPSFVSPDLTWTEDAARTKLVRWSDIFNLVIFLSCHTKTFHLATLTLFKQQTSSWLCAEHICRKSLQLARPFLVNQMIISWKRINCYTVRSNCSDSSKSKKTSCCKSILLQTWLNFKSANGLCMSPSW